MRKNQKIVFIVNTLADTLEEFKREIEKEVGLPVVLYNYDVTDSWEGDGVYYYQPKLFITLFDKNKQRISGNWVDTQLLFYKNYEDPLLRVISETEFNLLHYLWGEEVKAKDIRYANIAQRKFIEKDDCIVCEERGWELDIFKRVTTPYEKSFIYSRDKRGWE